MIYFNGTILENTTNWEYLEFNETYMDDALCISFPLPIQLDDNREAINYLKQHLQEDERQWLTFTGSKWRIDLNVFSLKFGPYIEQMRVREEAGNSGKVEILTFGIQSAITTDLLNGVLEIEPEFCHKNSSGASQTTIKFIITYQQMKEQSRAKRIFLSHKSADKPMVRQYRDMLKKLGFEPWMDEDDIKVRDKINRSIYKGIKESCVVIFFITANYVDERYLETEIDLAISEATEQGSQFRIITLILGDSPVDIQKIPVLLRQYVFKQPATQFEALKEILDGLPLRLPQPVFKH
jgi:hypothetical protein